MPYASAPSDARSRCDALFRAPLAKRRKSNPRSHRHSERALSLKRARADLGLLPAPHGRIEDNERPKTQYQERISHDNHEDRVQHDPILLLPTSPASGRHPLMSGSCNPRANRQVLRKSTSYMTSCAPLRRDRVRSGGTFGLDVCAPLTKMAPRLRRRSSLSRTGAGGDYCCLGGVAG